MNGNQFKDLQFMVRLFATTYLECDAQITVNYEQAYVTIVTQNCVLSISLSECHDTKECVLKCVQILVNDYLEHSNIICELGDTKGEH